MVDNSISRRSERRPLGTIGRRALLRAVGAGAALSASGGVVAGGGTEGGGVRHDDDGIDPQFGFPAPSADVEPPVEPDHEVEILIQPREGAEIPEFVFQPTGLYVEPGDTVRFSYVTPHHSITAYHPGFGYLQRVPDGVPPFSSPLLPAGAYWLYTFEQEGVYDLHCAPHEVFGHAMRIVAGSASGPGAEPLPDLCAAPPEDGSGSEGDDAEDGGDGDEGESESEDDAEGGGEEEPSPPRLTAFTVLSDPALDPEAIVEDGRVGWEQLDPESKRLFVEISGFPPCPDDG